MSKEDKIELAALLPEVDRQVQKDNTVTISEQFGMNSRYLYDAAVQWQNILAMGGFEKACDDSEPKPCTDPFKDENYERNWGDRIIKDKKQKAKTRGRSKKTKY